MNLSENNLNSKFIFKNVNFHENDFYSINTGQLIFENCTFEDLSLTFKGDNINSVHFENCLFDTNHTEFFISCPEKILGVTSTNCCGDYSGLIGYNFNKTYRVDVVNGDKT